jgi:hypothetical protein
MLRRDPARRARLYRRGRHDAAADRRDLSAIATKLTPGALIELQLSIGFYIMTSKFLETFGVDLQPVTEVV